MRVVLDTNVYISALIYRGKPEVLLLRLSRSEGGILTASLEILKELEAVLCRKFGWASDRANAVVEALQRTALMVTPTIAITECQDPDDNRILEAAVAGSADVIVSGDKHLLRMKEFRGIEILKVDEFLLRLDGV